MKKIGLLVMAYGTPYKEADIERYYTHIRRGRKPSEEMMSDLSRRYQAIGGISPLATITLQQAKALENYVNEIQEEVAFRVYVGLKHIEPFVEDAVLQMKQDGIYEAISIVLAPHYSTFSVKSYHARAQEIAAQLGNITISPINHWYENKHFIEYWVSEVTRIMAQFSVDEKEKAVVIFSAHSLPEKILGMKDPYPQQIKETADAIATASGISHYTVGWQSAGKTGEPWIGPDVQDLTRTLFHEDGYRIFIYCPVGFVSDHLEVLFDNDIECKGVTEELGASYYRGMMPNTNALFIQGLGEMVLEKYKEQQQYVITE